MNVDITSEILDFLAQNGLGAVGTDLYIGTLPEETVEGMFVIVGQSSPPHMYLDTFSVDIDFWYRHPKSNLGYQKLMQVYNLLHRRANWDTANYHIYFSHALGQVKDNDRDREDGRLYSLSVQFIARNTNIVS